MIKNFDLNLQYLDFNYHFLVNAHKFFTDFIIIDNFLYLNNKFFLVLIAKTVYFKIDLI